MPDKVFRKTSFGTLGVASSCRAFAAPRGSGYAYAWGLPPAGDTINVPALNAVLELGDTVKIVGNSRAFAGVRLLNFLSPPPPSPPPRPPSPSPPPRPPPPSPKPSPPPPRPPPSPKPSPPPPRPAPPPPSPKPSPPPPK